MICFISRVIFDALDVQYVHGERSEFSERVGFAALFSGLSRHALVY